MKKRVVEVVEGRGGGSPGEGCEIMWQQHTLTMEQHVQNVLTESKTKEM